MMESIVDKGKEEAIKIVVAQNAAEKQDVKETPVEGVCSAEFSRGCIIQDE